MENWKVQSDDSDNVSSIATLYAVKEDNTWAHLTP